MDKETEWATPAAEGALRGRGERRSGHASQVRGYRADTLHQHFRLLQHRDAVRLSPSPALPATGPTEAGSIVLSPFLSCSKLFWKLRAVSKQCLYTAFLHAHNSTNESPCLDPTDTEPPVGCSRPCRSHFSLDKKCI